MSMDNRRRPKADFMQDLMGLRTEDNEDDDSISDNFFSEYERKPKSTLQFPSNRIATIIDESELNVLSQSVRQSQTKPLSDEQPKTIEVITPIQTQTKPEPLKPVMVPTYPKVKPLQPVVITTTKIEPPKITEPLIEQPKVQEPAVPPKDKLVVE